LLPKSSFSGSRKWRGILETGFLHRRIFESVKRAWKSSLKLEFVSRAIDGEGPSMGQWDIVVLILKLI
jgi:hypothetical protein